VSFAIGCKNTGSENMPPIATQPSKPPAATTTQRYEEEFILVSVRSVWLEDEWELRGPTAGTTASEHFFRDRPRSRSA
jgi:hypothetical protein